MLLRPIYRSIDEFFNEFGRLAMNRKERRTMANRSPRFSGAVPKRDPATAQPIIADLIDEARRQYRQGNGAQAERLCKQVLSHAPKHVHSLNLIGLIAQSSDRYQLSLKMFARAIESDPLNAACHYNIGFSYQALGRHDEAIVHFKKAIALGLGEKNAEEFILQSSVIVSYVDRIEKEQLIKIDDLFDSAGFELIANELFLRCAMESVVIRGRTLEMFLTRLRFGLLRLAAENAARAKYGFRQARFLPERSRAAVLLKRICLHSRRRGNGHSIRSTQFVVRTAEQQRLNRPALACCSRGLFSTLSTSRGREILNREWPPTVDGLVGSSYVNLWKRSMIAPLFRD